MNRIRVTIWNEFVHERKNPDVAKIYPNGIHETIATALRKYPELEVRTATLAKYSRYKHSQSNEAPVQLPEPDEIAADLTRLQTWLKEFSERKIPQLSAANILVSSNP